MGAIHRLSDRPWPRRRRRPVAVPRAATWRRGDNRLLVVRWNHGSDNVSKPDPIRISWDLKGISQLGKFSRTRVSEDFSSFFFSFPFICLRLERSRLFWFYGDIRYWCFLSFQSLHVIYIILWKRSRNFFDLMLQWKWVKNGGLGLFWFGNWQPYAENWRPVGGLQRGP